MHGAVEKVVETSGAEEVSLFGQSPFTATVLQPVSGKILRNLYVVNAAAALGEGNGPRLSRVLALPARLG